MQYSQNLRYINSVKVTPINVGETQTNQTKKKNHSLKHMNAKHASLIDRPNVSIKQPVNLTGCSTVELTLSPPKGIKHIYFSELQIL